jgi:hypothetical protein
LKKTRNYGAIVSYDGTSIDELVDDIDDAINGHIDDDDITDAGTDDGEENEDTEK